MEGIGKSYSNYELQELLLHSKAKVKQLERELYEANNQIVKLSQGIIDTDIKEQFTKEIDSRIKGRGLQLKWYILYFLGKSTKAVYVRQFHSVVKKTFPHKTFKRQSFYNAIIELSEEKFIKTRWKGCKKYCKITKKGREKLNRISKFIL